MFYLPKLGSMTEIHPGSVEELLLLSQRQPTFTHAEFLAYSIKPRNVVANTNSLVYGRSEVLQPLISNQRRRIGHLLSELKVSGVKCHGVKAYKNLSNFKGSKLAIDNLPGDHEALIIEGEGERKGESCTFFFDPSLFIDPIKVDDLLAWSTVLDRCAPQFQGVSLNVQSTTPIFSTVHFAPADGILTVTQTIPCHLLGKDHTYRQYHYLFSDLKAAEGSHHDDFEEVSLSSELLGLKRAVLEVLIDDNSLIEIVMPTDVHLLDRVTVRKHGGKIVHASHRDKFDMLLRQAADHLGIEPEDIIQTMRQAISTQNNLKS